MVSPSSFFFSPCTEQSALGLLVLQEKGSFRSCIDVCVHAQGRICCMCSQRLCQCPSLLLSPKYRGGRGGTAETLQKCLWPGSQWVQSGWEEQGHVSQRSRGLPTSGIPLLAGRETQCTPPFPTFPSHSVGYYMFIEASRPRVTGDKARLISPLYNITAKYYCVSFYYHMYGKHIGEYPPGKGSPSPVWAVGEDLQPPLHQLCRRFRRVGALLQSSKHQRGLSLSDTCPLPTPQQCQRCEAVAAHPWGSILQSAIIPSPLALSSSGIRLPTLHKKEHCIRVRTLSPLTATATLLWAAGHQVNSLSIREEVEVVGLCGTGGLCGGRSYFGVGRMRVPSAVPSSLCLLCLAPSPLTCKPTSAASPPEAPGTLMSFHIQSRSNC